MSAARCAIRMRSQESDTSKALKLLRQDLINGPSHSFGIHTGCSPDFCTTAKNMPQQISSSESGNSDGGEDPAEDESDLEGT